MSNRLAFPRRMTIDLTESQRESLEQLANAFPYDSDELLNEVVAKGVNVMLRAMLQAERVKPSPVSPSHVPFGMKRTFKEQHAMDAQYDRETARLERDLGRADDARPADHRHVPQTISVPLSEDLRRSLEDYLDAHPDFGVQDALSILVRRGLDHTEELEEVVQSAREQQATAMLELAERLHARAKRHCAR